MIPYSISEAETQLTLHGTVVTLTRWIGNKVETFILEPEEFTLKELQNETKKL